LRRHIPSPPPVQLELDDELDPDPLELELLLAVVVPLLHPIATATIPITASTAIRTARPLLFPLIALMASLLNVKSVPHP
jgi:hypothetical protein